MVQRAVAIVARIALLFLLVYFFLGVVELFGSAAKDLAGGRVQRYIEGLANPFAGLSVGILITVAVQSSSVTTAAIVAAVADGLIPLPVAVYMVMGANIGTSITNTLVSLGHVTRKEEFRRAFAGATVHDFFNLLTVAIVLPLQWSTGFLESGAKAAVSVLPLGGEGATLYNPLKAAIKGLAHLIRCALEFVGLGGNPLVAAMFIVAFLMFVLVLRSLTRTMRALMDDRIEEWLNGVLQKSGVLGILMGAVITMLVQSSSITTSLLIPMFGAGVLTLQAGFPIMIGANIGTTVTALLAASVKALDSPNALVIAVVHLLFNLCGTMLFFPIPAMRRIPIWLSERLADAAVRHRYYVVIYILLMFVALPLLALYVSNWVATWYK